ncbi:MAG: hypothetical protein U9R75_00730, partial [Candidatus Thermoplasmatota archaeon]|nr:hypothetical protein [Candidatus Thermoplasmatota archaeon]
MKPIIKSVVRKLYKMKWRVIAISLVVSLAMAMFTTGLYTAVIFDHSMDTFIEETNFPDVFISLSEPMNYSVVDDEISNISGIEAYSLRLKLDGVYHHNGDDYPAVIIGIESSTRKDISRLLLKDGEFFSGPGEGNVIPGMDDIGVGKDETLSLSTLGIDLNITVTGSV